MANLAPQRFAGISPLLQLMEYGYLQSSNQCRRVLLLLHSHPKHVARCAWIDVLFTQAFGHNMPAIICPKACRLQPKDPRTVKNFVDCYRKLILDNNILDQVKKREDQIRYPLPLYL